jgi:uncharacterized membrane protein YciS (DUF1049 family)
MEFLTKNNFKISAVLFVCFVFVLSVGLFCFVFLFYLTTEIKNRSLGILPKISISTIEVHVHVHAEGPY